MNYTIAAIPGDGIGPEVVREAALILQKIGEEFNHSEGAIRKILKKIQE